jgi:hypothetical protein
MHILNWRVRIGLCCAHTLCSPSEAALQMFANTGGNESWRRRTELTSMAAQRGMTREPDPILPRLGHSLRIGDAFIGNFPSRDSNMRGSADFQREILQQTNRGYLSVRLWPAFLSFLSLQPMARDLTYHLLSWPLPIH